jgi:DNA-binding NtrC family response regulator
MAKMPLPFLPRALVVEDDEDLRDFAATILEETDLALAASTSFEDARPYLDEHASELALVFLAIDEPHLRNGVNLAYDIEDDWPWIKLLVSSDEAGFRRSYLPRTASYLPKPWHALDLLIEAERASWAGFPLTLLNALRSTPPIRGMADTRRGTSIRSS